MFYLPSMLILDSCDSFPELWFYLMHKLNDHDRVRANIYVGNVLAKWKLANTLTNTTPSQRMLVFDVTWIAPHKACSKVIMALNCGL